MNIEITDNKIDIDCSDMQASLLGNIFLALAVGLNDKLNQRHFTALGELEGDRRVNIQIKKED